MSNLKSQDPKYAGGKPRAFKGWSLLAGLILVALLAVSPSLLGLADAGENSRSFEVSFTKWMISPTGAMIGVVGEDVGAGTFAGQVLSMTKYVDDEGRSFTDIVAEYHINGSKHSFSADIKAVQDNGAGTGVITGVITEGWLKGRALSGTYNVLNPCNMATKDNVYGDPGLCFQGTLNVPAAP